jgi:cephalosporin hydroxylase
LLSDLFSTFGTDKGYHAPVYEMLLRDKREAVRNVLEIGIGTLIPTAHSSMAGYASKHYRPGGSLRAWRDYFPNAQIVGIDIQPDTQFREERIRTYLCNSTERKSVTSLVADLPRFDMVVDDGSHDAKDQLATLRNFYPAVVPGGLYFLEDVVEGSTLHHAPNLVEKVVGRANYFVTDDYRGARGERWKMIVIRADTKARRKLLSFARTTP